MKPILLCIAEAYTKRYEDLSGICFLFPNKRCGTMLKHYLDKTIINKSAMPAIKTISDFISDVTGLEEAGSIESIFTLYNSYVEVYKKNFGEDEEKIPDFESFKNWGETIISDFNTVDQYLVDPTEIFKNVKDYREITTNFLTEEQKEILRDYFGYEDFDDSGSFWKNFYDSKKDSSIKQKFLNLWQILGDLHEVFLKSLVAKKKSTIGGIYRKAVETLEEVDHNPFPYRKIVIFGFNAINGAERKIFSLLKEFKGFDGNDDFVDFIWDATGPVLNNVANSCSRFIVSNKKHFPMPEWLNGYIRESDSNSLPDIRIIASPSNTMQPKIAGEVLREYKAMNGEAGDAERALVLPDETLLINTLYSIPDSFETINLTMGYPFRQTSIASFMTVLRRLYATTRVKEGKNIFFNKDLKLVLSHPYSYILFDGNQINDLMDYISRFHKISVSLEELEDKLTNASFVFGFPSKNVAGDDFFEYLQRLFEFMTERFSSQEEVSHLILELSQIEEYASHITSLKESINEYGMEISSIGVMNMVEKLISTVKIGFEGLPIEGLQIMGTLETRGLDFKEVVIMSMNEGMMPRRSKIKTFIPETLRKGYGLPPSGYNEEIFAYYFYRLISRAEKVSLIYDSRIGGGLKRGGISRYLLQLRHFGDKNKIKEETWSFNLKTSGFNVSDIVKTPEINRRLNSFIYGNHPSSNFSASSLNTYRECQAKFCLRYLFNLNPDPEATDFLDSITVGNVLHHVMMQLYLDRPMQGKFLEKPLVITKEKIENLLNNESVIKKYIAEKINRDFYRLEKDALGRELPDSSLIVAEELLGQIKAILRYDHGLAPFRLYGCEISEHMVVNLPSGRKVNFKFAIDRLDEVMVEGKPRLRIVDYKTGMRKREAKNIDEVLRGDYRSEQLFQLFVYAWLLNYYDVPGKEDVMTEIYFVPDLLARSGGLPKIGKDLVKSYRDYAEEFERGVKDMIEEIFDSEKFLVSSNNNDCENCAFKYVCRNR